MKSYTYHIDIASGTFGSASVIDGDGETWHTVPEGFGADNGSQMVSFQINEESDSMALWAYTNDSTISVSYNITSQPLPTAVSSASFVWAAESRAHLQILMLMIMFMVMVDF